MNSFVKKLTVSVIAVFLIFGLVITTLILRSSTDVVANVSFSGISSIVGNSSKERPFRIVEVVPNAGMGELGYMVEGSEPIKWLDDLSTMYNSSTKDADGNIVISNEFDRSSYVNEKLKNLWAPITDGDGERNTNLLHYESYEEKYQINPDDAANWEVLNFAGTETIPKDTVGYKMVNVGNDIGSYSFMSDYIPQEDPTKGDYNQNVLSYQYTGSGYYGLAMEEISTDGIVTYEQMLGIEGGAYKASSATAYVNDEKMQAFIAENPTASVYRISKENIRASYEFVGYASEINNLDFDTYIYFSVKMEYVPVEEMDNTKKYYTISDGGVRFFYDESGEYSGVLDEERPYVEVNEGSIGNFLLDTASFIYTYVGAGNGEFELVLDENGKLDYPTNVNFVYYKGGFTNNNWFKNGVFNQDNSLSEEKDVFVNVETYTADMLYNLNWTDVDLLYINGSSSILSNHREDNGNIVADSFNADNDISWEVALEVLKWANASGFYMPVIVDYSIFNGSVANNGTNMQKLAALLCSTNYSNLNVGDGFNPNNFNWGSVTYTSDNDQHYVKDNIYVIPGDTVDTTPFIYQNFNSKMLNTVNSETEFLNNYKQIGFGEIAEYINQENLIRRTENNAGNNYAYFDLDISKAIVVEYIICYANRRVVEINTELNILDIEPCYTTSDNSGRLTTETVKSWLGTNSSTFKAINITHESSAEFIGKIEDLNKYDLIYFGLSTEQFNMNNNRTDFNDPNMDGLIYTNIGDLIAVQPTDENKHSGIFVNDYLYNSNNEKYALNKDYSVPFDYKSINTYRASGNDLTSEKVSKLENFLKAGLPIIFADGFISTDGKAVNSNYIDNCSKIYDFVRDNLSSSYTMTSTQAKNNGASLYNYLTMNKPEIVISEIATDNNGFIPLNSNVVNLEFSINNNGGVDVNALFGIKFMLDSNADGKFSATQEVIMGNELSIYQNGKFVAPKHNSEDNTYYYELSAGTQYKYSMSYVLPEGYVGVIPWKLSVFQTTNEYRYDSTQGYFYRENSTGKKTKINILQINTASRRTFKGETFDNGKTTFNMQEQYEKTYSEFSKLVRDLKDYELNIVTYASDVFGDKYAKAPENGIKDSNKIYLDDYDMIIMGFADVYTIDNKNGCVEGIKDYIAEGNPVLFTHDTTSMDNDDTRGYTDSFWKKWVWGYDFNKIARELVGMDRYGVMTNEHIKKGNTLDNTSATDDEFDKAVSVANKQKKDVAYLPNSNKQTIVRQSQGFTDLDLNIYQDRDKTGLQIYKGLPKGRSNEDLNVSKVNSGQITNYPYKIPDSFKVSETHMQYYQLDFNQDADGDGESDIVVWYTLGDAGSKWYSKSLKDVRNNYYIYTMGNVTYSGVGHSDITSNSNELKLYINTMIAAYSAKAHEPTVSLKENDSLDSPDLGTVYVSVDDMLNQQIEGEDAKEVIYFNVTDTNLVRNLKSKYIYADFYIEVSEAEYNQISNDEKKMITNEDKTNTIYLKKISVDISAAESNNSYNLIQTKMLASGVTYQAQIPLSVLPDNKNYVDVYCVAHTEIVKFAADKISDGSKETTNDAYESFRIQRVKLQNLD